MNEKEICDVFTAVQRTCRLPLCEFKWSVQSSNYVLHEQMFIYSYRRIYISLYVYPYICYSYLHYQPVFQCHCMLDTHTVHCKMYWQRYWQCCLWFYLVLDWNKNQWYRTSKLITDVLTDLINMKRKGHKPKKMQRNAISQR